MNFPYLNSKLIDVPANIDQLTVVQLSSDTFKTVSLTSTNIQAQSCRVDSLTSNNLSAIEIKTNNSTTNYNVIEIVGSKIFTNADNSKAFHFKTTISPVITAVFPLGNLNDGFNVSIFNDGTGTILISSTSTPSINATGSTNATQNTAMFIYKASNQLYGIGVLE